MFVIMIMNKDTNKPEFLCTDGICYYFGALRYAIIKDKEGISEVLAKVNKMIHHLAIEDCHDENSLAIAEVKFEPI